jgi:hypothetical protein
MNTPEQLRDIKGLDTISWWPLAPGWWLLIATSLILIILIIIMGIHYGRRLAQRNSKIIGKNWREVAMNEWLAQHPKQASPREQIAFLSILLRRVAIQRHGRETCAGLTGERWLAWLTEHDPLGFNWAQSGRIIIELPYMPPDSLIDNNQVEVLYRTVAAWIEAED